MKYSENFVDACMVIHVSSVSQKENEDCAEYIFKILLSTGHIIQYSYQSLGEAIKEQMIAVDQASRGRVTFYEMAMLGKKNHE